MRADDDDPAADRPAPGRRPYLVLMSLCVLLIVMAWTWVYRVSTPAAVVMSVLAMPLPPLAAIVANAGRETPQLRRQEQQRRSRHRP
jgi:hypothetical protein